MENENRAGVTDSALTNHGVLQTKRLGQYFAAAGLRFTNIFSSDLQRARMTADAVRAAQPLPALSTGGNTTLQTVQLPILREQDFGSFECKPWNSRATTSSTVQGINQGDVEKNSKDPVDKESHESMLARTTMFLDDHLHPLLLADQKANKVVAVVSHGILLSVLWRCLLMRFAPQTVMLAPGVGTNASFRPLAYLPAWSNTGYLELDLIPTGGDPANVDADKPIPALHSVALSHGDASIASSIPAVEPYAEGSSSALTVTPLLADWRMTVKTLNGKDHLSNLKRTGGGVGSSKYDERQKNIEGFFKKQKIG